MINEYKLHERGDRPWGSWKVDEIGEGFIKKTITVNVGGCLSLQSHNHRSEEWEIIEGVAEVTLGNVVKTYPSKSRISIPQKTIHRLKNAGNSVLIVTEIQRGEILSEDDIIRYEDIYGREKPIFLADMDGTLTPARLPMSSDFELFFLDFIKKHTFFVVSGSDFKKVNEQMTEAVIDNLAGLFCSMGNQLYINNELVYSNEFNPSPDLAERLESYRANTDYPGPLFDNYIERRPGMINFSVLGRNCPHDQRNKYKQWDDVHKERIRIAAELSKNYPDYDVSVGGNISIDIVPQGFGKEQVASIIRKKYPSSKIIFLGDRTEEGGNDYSLAQALLSSGNSEVVPVTGPEDTLKFLEKFI